MADSTPPGGPAAINGFLYQILANLEHVASSQTSAGAGAGGDADTLTVCLEPSAGDAQYTRAGAQTLIEQYKTKSGGRTWNIRTVVEEVLTDLLKAVVVGRPAVYRFVTDGKEGRWGELRRICGLLKLEDATSEPGSSLDSSTKRKFFNDPKPARIAGTKAGTAKRERESWELPKTDSDFFAYVTRSLIPKVANDTASHAARVRQLLAGLDLVADATEEKFVAAIDALLSQIVEYREEVPNKRRELYGLVLKKSAIGNVRITADALLAEAGLHAKPMRDRDALARRCAIAVKGAVAALSYDASTDVRQVQPLAAVPVTILSGESGMGKTWALCALTLELLSDSRPAVIVRPRDTADATLQAISDAIWVEGRGMDRPLLLHAVHRRLGMMFDGTEDPAGQGESLCTIALDDVQNTDTASFIAEHIERLPGFRLVLSAPEQVANALHARLGPQRSRLVQLLRLSAVELRHLLVGASMPYDDLPSEFRQTLGLPVLAKLYCEIGQGKNFVPESEYALFKRYYEIVWTRGEQPEHPEDQARLLQLVASTARGSTTYPWRLPCEALGDSRQRLQRIGLLRPTPDRQSLEIWHDRVLNWFVAEALVIEREQGRLELEDLVAVLTAMYGNEPGASGRRLGYVPMDYLWLSLAGETDAAVRDAHHIAGGLESVPPDRGFPRTLYEGMLPTLGARACVIYRSRLEALDPDSREASAVYPTLTNGLVRIGSGCPDPVAALVPAWLSTTNERLVEVAIDLAAAFPSAERLDGLWLAHQSIDLRIDRLAKVDEHESMLLRQVKQRCVEALRRAASLDKTWLLDRIKATSRPGDLVGLGYVLVGVSQLLGARVWPEVKGRFFDGVPSDRRRVLALCVRQFSDTAETARLIAWLEQREDMVGEAAFAALAHVDPDAAVLHIRTSIEQSRYTTSWWAPLLLQTRRIQSLAEILELMKTGPKGMYAGLATFRGLEDEIDASVWNFALDKLQERVAADLQGGLQNTPGGFSSPFTFAVSATKAELLTLIRQRIGTPLERDICLFAIARLDRLDDFQGRGDDVMREAIQLLKRIGGGEYGRFVLAALTHASPTARIWGFSLAAHIETSVARTEALRIAREASLRGDAASAREWRFALDCLLRLGDTDSVIDLCLTSIHRATPDLLDALENPTAGVSVQPGKVGVAAMLDPLKGPAAIVAAAVHGTEESMTLLQDAFEHLGRDSEPARIAGEALLARGVGGDRVRRILAEMLHGPANREFATASLLSIGTDDALQDLLAHYSADAVLEGDRDATWAVLLRLLGTSRGDQAALTMRGWYERGRKPVTRTFLRYLPRLGVADAHETLLELASTDSNWQEQEWQALEGLFSIDRDAALGSAQRILSKRPARARRDLPPALVRLGGQDVLPLLCRHVVEEDDKPTRSQIGRSLRSIASSVLEQHLAPMLEHVSEKTRLRGIELAGWQPSGFSSSELARMAEGDPEPDVRVAAATACRQQRAEDLTREIMAQLKTTTDARVRVGLLDALTQRIDPFLAELDTDPLFVYGLLVSQDEVRSVEAVLAYRREKEARSF